MRKIKVVVLLVQQLQHGFTKNAKVSPNLTVAQYVTMRITFNIPEFTRNERNSNCDVLHIAPVRVANLVLDEAIAAIQTSRERPIDAYLPT